MVLGGCGGDDLSGTTASSGTAGEGGEFSSGGTGGTSQTGSGATTATGSTSTQCDTPLAGGPAAQPYPFELNGQQAWSHDDGIAAGYFHTYDALDVGGSEPHKVHVFLPRDYAPCDEGYPVVYMNDGGTAFWPGGPGNKTWDVANSLGDLWSEGAVPQLIVVAIEPNDRDFEYSYAPWTDGVVCCGADVYADYVADHVKAFIDTAYQTHKEREQTAIVGSSRGGLSAFYLATRRPDIFGHAGCLSPSFWAGLDPVFGGTLPGGSLEESGLIQPVTDTLSNASARPRVWIDWGLVRTGGFHNEVIEEAATVRGKEMTALLESTFGYVKGQDLEWEEDPIGEHDEISWARRFPHVMKFFFAP
ncbi:MAG: alpha/beta hydrolase [Polyangiaceae bacterium]|nr:alpha/beta hydrolase [Polyangiaceae bacterium]